MLVLSLPIIMGGSSTGFLFLGGILKASAGFTYNTFDEDMLKNFFMNNTLGPTFFFH